MTAPVTAAKIPQPPRERNDFADFLKGALILLVVWGHLLQFTHPGSRFYVDPVFKAIYMFHMPLFMAVSGFMSFRPISRSTLFAGCLHRFRQIVVPAICLPALLTFVALVCFTVHAGTVSGGIHALKQSSLLFHPVLWFLWAVFGATVVVAIMKQFALDRLQYFTLAFVAFLFAPDGADLFLFKYLFPFFCLGYALARGDQIHLPKTIPPFWTIATFAAALVCYLLWQTDTFVYTTKTHLSAANLPNILLRYLGGIAGSLAFLLALRAVYPFAKSKTLSAWGRHSLDIYIIHSVILAPAEAFWTPQVNSIWFSLLGAPVLAAVICWLTCLIGRFIGDVPIAGSLLLGKSQAKPA